MAMHEVCASPCLWGSGGPGGESAPSETRVTEAPYGRCYKGNHGHSVSQQTREIGASVGLDDQDLEPGVLAFGHAGAVLEQTGLEWAFGR